MKARLLTLFGLLSIGLAALTSCTDAIFATIETATKTTTNTLSLTLTIYDIAVPLPGYYSVAAGGVFNGVLAGLDPGTVSWTPNINNSSRPFNPPGTACNAMTFFPVTGFLYGGFVTTSGSASFWRSNGTYSFGPGQGTQITLPAPSEQVTFLRSVNNVLFMGGATPTSTGFVFELDSSPDGVTWTRQITGLAYPITGVGYDGANYWAVSSPYAVPTSGINYSAILYKGPLGFLVQIASPVPPGDQINDLYTDPANNIFLTTRQNGVYYYTGASWNSIGPDHQNGNTPVSYLCVAGPVGSDGIAPQDIYLVGSDGFGYYTMSTGGNSLSRYGNTTIILYTSSISRIAYDNSTGNGIVLMGTNNSSSTFQTGGGLWRATFDTTGNIASGQSWIQE
ncbi:MAG: hypothetical protein ACLQDL_09625 [Spirochaetia bacterium]